MASKVVVVTGANKGIGYHIVKNLAKEGFKVVLGGRNDSLIKEAQDKLKTEENVEVDTAKIDLNDPSGVQEAAASVQERYGKIHALVNNAGFAFKGSATEPFAEQAEVTNAVNYFGTLAVTHAFLPLIEDGGRIVTTSSSMGNFSKLRDDLRATFNKPDLTEHELSELIRRFVRSAQEGKHKEDGWPESAYGVSKIAETTLTRILARDHPNLHVYCACPGWCRTDMAGDKATKSAAQGADDISYLVTAPVEGLKAGHFYSEKQPKDIY